MSPALTTRYFGSGRKPPSLRPLPTQSLVHSACPAATWLCREAAGPPKWFVYGYHGDAGRRARGLAGRQAGRVKMLPRSALAWTVEEGALPGVGEPLAAREVRLPLRVHRGPLLLSSPFCPWIGERGDDSELCLLSGSGRGCLYFCTLRFSQVRGA